MDAERIWAQGAFEYTRRSRGDREKFCGFYTVWDWSGEIPEGAGPWVDRDHISTIEGLPGSLRILLLSVLADAGDEDAMTHDIRTGRAIVERDGRILLSRETAGCAWEPSRRRLRRSIRRHRRGHGLAPALLRHRHGPAVDDDFLQTYYFHGDEAARMVLNLYALTEWAGRTTAAARQRSSSWVNPERSRAMTEMAERVRDRECSSPLGSLRRRSLRSPATCCSPGGQWTSRRGLATAGRVGRDADARAAAAIPSPRSRAWRARSPRSRADVIDFALGEVWSHPALDRKTRSLQVVAMLSALGRTWRTAARPTSMAP